MDVLVDAREVLRNDALLLLIQLTKGHANLQKIVAFENAFDKLCDIMETVSIYIFLVNFKKILLVTIFVEDILFRSK